MSYKVGILIVSDSATEDSNLDKTGPALKQLIQDKYGSKFVVQYFGIVKDDVKLIENRLGANADEYDLFLTSGGTGFGPNDNTPEAVLPYIEKRAPGLEHVMMQTSLTKTPMAALSRSIAGIALGGKTLIVTLPGSPKGAIENFEAIGQVLPHAIELMLGGSGKVIHDDMHGHDHRHKPFELSGHSHSHSHSHSHNHHHGHHHHKHNHGHGHDAKKGPAGRARKSPYPIIPLEEAYKIINNESKPLPIVDMVVNANLVGHSLAQDVFALGDRPEGPTTNVDGYAIDVSILEKNHVYDVHPYQSNEGASSGKVYRVNTGSGIPATANAVVMVEDTELELTSKDGKDEELQIKILDKVNVGENVRQGGSDVKKGEFVMGTGTIISGRGGELGTLAFTGHEQIKVYSRPRVAIMSTGNELRNIGEKRGQEQEQQDIWHDIVDSNRPSLKMALESEGYQVIDLGIIKDDIEETKKAIRKGIEEADVIITTGGTSMGERDFLKPVIERELGGKIHFGRVAMKPGKPTTFASVEKQDNKKCLIFALPGNPASALVTLHLFAIPCLRQLSGYPINECQFPKVKAFTTEDMKMDPRPEFHRVLLEATQDGRLQVKSTGGQRSSRTTSMAGATGLVCLPSGQDIVKAGSMVDVLVLGQLRGLS